jgi:hypothetical protein
LKLKKTIDATPYSHYTIEVCPDTRNPQKGNSL